MPQCDDLTVSDDETLLRRVHPDWIIRNENTGVTEVSTGAFSDSSDGTGMSASAAGLLSAAGMSEDDALAGYDGYGLVALRVGQVRELGQAIVRRPTDRDPAHVEVVGKKTRAIKKAFKRAAVWVVCPP